MTFRECSQTTGHGEGREAKDEKNIQRKERQRKEKAAQERRRGREVGREHCDVGREGGYRQELSPQGAGAPVLRLQPCISQPPGHPACYSMQASKTMPFPPKVGILENVLTGLLY